MSYDLMVFESKDAPQDKEAFLDWYHVANSSQIVDVKTDVTVDDVTFLLLHKGIP